MKRRKISDMTLYPDQDSNIPSSIQGFPEENIKKDMPSVDTALRRLEALIDKYLKQGTPVIKIIHGYGSNGVGGEIKKQVHTRLRRYERDKIITGFIPGEQFDRTRIGLHYLEDFPSLDWDSDFGRSNRGITIVLIRTKDLRK